MSGFRSLQGGRTQFSRCCNLIIDLGSYLVDGSWTRSWRSHRISAVELGCYIHTLLGHCGHHFVVVPQWFIDFSTDPQLVKQYGQLPRYRNDRSLLSILAPAFG